VCYTSSVLIQNDSERKDVRIVRNPPTLFLLDVEKSRDVYFLRHITSFASKRMLSNCAIRCKVLRALCATLTYLEIKQGFDHLFS